MPEPAPRLVTVIIPVYNRPGFLRAAAHQVFSQTYPHVELTIVDDGSTDATGDVADEIAKSAPISTQVVRRENGGPGAARETGRQMANGEFLQYFDSDDVIDPRKLEVQVAALDARPDCGIAYCRTREYSADETPSDVCSQFTGERMDLLFPRILSGCCWPTVTPLIRRSVSDQAGPWMSLRHEEDWEYDARIAAMGVRLVYCDEFLAAAVNHAGPRASDDSSNPIPKLRDRCTAHLEILKHAVKFGVPTDDPDRRHFSRELFLLARMCGAAGLTDESKRLFDAAVAASGDTRGRAADFRFYRAFAKLFGWRVAGSVACAADRWRRQS